MRSSEPIAGSRASIIPTLRTTSRRPSIASRRSTRPTKCSPIPGKRAQYDRFGVVGNGASARPGDFGFGAGSFGDIFDMFFGNVRGRNQPRRAGPERGSDLRYDVEITLEEAFHGTTKEIAFDRLAHCDACKGTGARPGTMIVPCDRCGGSGTVRSARQTPLGQIVTQMACTRCGGEGHVIAQPCERCGGRGRRETETRLTVNVPAGVDDGSRIRIAGNGEAGTRGGPPGDLYVYLDDRAAPALQTRRPRYVRRRAGELSASGARARRSKCRRSAATWS